MAKINAVLSYAIKSNLNCKLGKYSAVTSIIDTINDRSRLMAEHLQQWEDMICFHKMHGLI